jgi:hypothetical protein
MTLAGSTYTSPATVWVTLLTSLTNFPFLPIEVTTNTGYARQAFVGAVTTPAWRALNTAQIDFPAATTPWGTVTHLAVYDSSTIGAGNCLYYSAVTSPQAVPTGDTARLSVNSLVIRLGD